MIGHPPYLRHGMNQYENWILFLDNSEELIMPIAGVGTAKPKPRVHWVGEPVMTISIPF